ncbi:hypothetical protein GQ457_18G016750 [Hibiscus cannabinus]
MKIAMVTTMTMMMMNCVMADYNAVYSPCEDAKVQKSDGFTFGLAFSKKESFSFQNVQLSPCDSRLGLATKTAKLAVFRPKIDEISLLTIDGSTPLQAGGYMVAFAGRKYAARSLPIMVADNNNTITGFTLVTSSRIPERYTAKSILEKFRLCFMFNGLIYLSQRTRLCQTNLKMWATLVQFGNTVGILRDRQEPRSSQFMVRSQQTPTTVALWTLLGTSRQAFLRTVFYNWFMFELAS